MMRPDVSPDDPVDHQPVIGVIGMGAMGRLYATHLSAAGWKRFVRPFFKHVLLSPSDCVSKNPRV